jgi:hypothetical protein
MILCCLASAACAMEVEGGDDEGELDGEGDGEDLDDIEAFGLCDSTDGFISRRVDNPPGRPVARIELGSAPTARIRTNRGYLDIAESNVDAFDNHWTSGCKGKFCVLYWQNSDGYYMYANVPRSIMQVRANDVWRSAERVCVRRLGNLPLEGETALRHLNPTHNLDDICHTDSTGSGCLPYSAYAFISGPCEGGGTCTYTTGADTPPMYRITLAGREYIGRGYTTGVYSAGKEFHRLNASVFVPVKRISDGAPGQAEWIYGYVNIETGRVYMWVIRRAIVNGTTYWGYVTY